MSYPTPTHGRVWAFHVAPIHSPCPTRPTEPFRMRWPVVRLIARRELRDQLRDRRTLFLILGLPVLMYPLFVGVALMFAAALKDKKLVVGVGGAEPLPAQSDDPKAFPPLIVDDKFVEKYLPTDEPESGGRL